MRNIQIMLMDNDKQYLHSDSQRRFRLFVQHAAQLKQKRALQIEIDWFHCNMIWIEDFIK